VAGPRRLPLTPPSLASILSPAFLFVPSASPAVISTLSGKATSRRRAPLAAQNFLGRDVPAPIQTLHYFGEATSRRRGLPSEPKTFWDETSQPPSRPSIISGLETSRLHTSPALATPVISSALPVSFPNPSSKP